MKNLNKQYFTSGGARVKVDDQLMSALESRDDKLRMNIYLLVGKVRINNKDQVVNTIKDFNDICQVNTIGLGEEIDASFVKKCAIAGRGNYNFISYN
jgi:LEA14-like dessication related protein